MEIGTTSFKNKIKVNQTFMAADLKVTLSGIKVHKGSSVRVAVYPYGGMQHQEIELDG